MNTVKKTVLESVQGILHDPDYGLELKDAFVKKLEKIKKRTPRKTSSLQEIKKKYL